MTSTEEKSKKDDVMSIEETDKKDGITEVTKPKQNLQEYIVGSGLFGFCLIFLMIIYVVDIVHGGNYTETILETVKTLCFTICGYLFGRSKLN